MKSKVAVDIKNNKLVLTFNGIITKKELSSLYTDVRFGVGDLQKDFTVLSDFSNCTVMNLDALPTFRKILHFIITNNSGEIVRVLPPDQVVSLQIINATIYRKGYRPIYASTREEAESKIELSKNRDGLRFDLEHQPLTIIFEDQSFDGMITNLSTSGCAISSPSFAAQEGQVVQTKFSFVTETSDEPCSFEINAQVMRTDEEGFAVQFTSFDDPEKNTLWCCLLNQTVM